MKFTPVLLLLTLLFPAQFSDACTTLQFQGTEHKLVGNNLNWVSPFGRVFINPRGLSKISALGPNPPAAVLPHTWTSKYSSVTFNQVSRELPYGGMNENGLVIEVMVAPFKSEIDLNKPAVNELQWVQFMLDTAASTAEVVAIAPLVQVIPVAGSLHYLACDRTAECAVVEFEGGLKITTGSALDYPVLANHLYAQSRKALSTFEGFGGSKPLPASNDWSSDVYRFVKAAVFSKATPGKDPVAYAFEALLSIGNTSRSSISEWNLVYDPSNLKAYFRTSQTPSIRSVDFSTDHAYCNQGTKVLDMNMSGQGDQRHLFTDNNAAKDSEFIQENNAGLKAQLVFYLERFMPTATWCR